jgi:hypothetical protein
MTRHGETTPRATGRQEIYTSLDNDWDRNDARDRLPPVRGNVMPGRQLSGVGASAIFACVGGILDAFTYFGHGRVFANSMTGNVVLLGVNVMQKDWHQALRHLFPICSFFVGISAARSFYMHPLSGKIQDPDLAVLTLEMALFGAIGCLPDASSDFLITNTIAFAASLQSEAFRSVEGFPFKYYKGGIQLLLPLCIGNPQAGDLALVVENHDQLYRAATCLTLDMAYNNARQLARPDRDWLQP